MSETLMQMEIIEHAHCPRCGGAIPTEATFSHIPAESRGPTLKHVEIYCEFCGGGFGAWFVLQAGCWQPHTEAKRLPAKRVRELQERTATLQRSRAETAA